MRKMSLRKKLIPAFLAVVFSATAAFGQLNNIEFLKGGVNNANYLLKEYISPWGTSLGTSLNGGWYNTAKPHRLGGFDVTFTVNLTVVPSSGKSFTIDETKLTDLSLSDPFDNVAPTIAGRKQEGPLLAIKAPGNITLLEFPSPAGTNFGIIPLPMAQAGVGLIKGTEIIGRYLPKLNIMDAGSIGLWGVGLKHSVIQWLPGSKLIPFELTLFGGYTRLTSRADVDFNPNDYPGAVVSTTASFGGQYAAMDVSAWTINLLASKSLAVLTVYGGAGYSATKANLGLFGNYPIASVNTTGPAPFMEITDDDVYNNPIDLEIESMSGLRLNAGLRLKLAILTFHFDYTWADFSVYTGGIGFSFR